jgi:tetratricopeptide (TPR) repeat protein
MMRVQVRVFKGSTREAATDKALGSVSLELAPLLQGKPLVGTFPLEVEEGSVYEGSVRVRVTADAALSEARRGGRFLTVAHALLDGVPFAWSLPPPEGGRAAQPDPEKEAAMTEEDHAKRVAACEDAEVNTHRYVLHLCLKEEPTEAEAVWHSKASEHEWEVTLGRGSLKYVKDEDSWKWRVEWEGADSGGVFLSRDQVSVLRSRAVGGGSARVFVRRVQTEATDPTDDVDREFHLGGGLRALLEDVYGQGVVDIPLSGLARPDVLACTSDGGVLSHVPTPEDVERAEAEKESREERWAEYEASKAASAGGKAPGKKTAAKKAPAKGGKAPAKGGKDAPAEVATPRGPLLEGSSLSVTLQLDEPLVATPPPPPAPVLKAVDLVPSRPPPPMGELGFGATDEFRRDVMLATHTIAEQYLTISRRTANTGAPEQRRKMLLSQLNDSGLYLAMKERLKRSVVRVVRERFRDAPRVETSSPDEAGVDKDVFVTQLYTFLVGQMNRALNAVFDAADAEAASENQRKAAASRAVSSDSASKDAPMSATMVLAREMAQLEGGVSKLLFSSSVTLPTGSKAAVLSPPEPLVLEDDGIATGDEALVRPCVDAALETSSGRALRLALEAEFRGQLSIAEKHHQTRVIKAEETAVDVKDGVENKYDPQVWTDYGMFLCRQRRHDKARVAFSEAVSIDTKGFTPLMGLGLCTFEAGKAGDALVFVRDACGIAMASAEDAWGRVCAVLDGDSVPGYPQGVWSPEDEEDASLPAGTMRETPSQFVGGSVESVRRVEEWAAAALRVVLSHALAARIESESTGMTSLWLRKATAFAIARCSLLARCKAEAAFLKGVKGWDDGTGKAISLSAANSAEGLRVGGLTGSEAEAVTGVWSVAMVLSAWLLDLGADTEALGQAHAAEESTRDMSVPTDVRVQTLVLKARCALCRSAPEGVPSAIACASRGDDAGLKEEDTSEAVVYLQEALDMAPRNPRAWRVLAEAHLLQGQLGPARKALESAVGGWSAAHQAAASPLTLLRLADAYLWQHQAGVSGEMVPSMVKDSAAALCKPAKEVYLLAAKRLGWAIAWAGAGVAALEGGDLDDSEVALSEANIRDTANPDIWAWLCSLCLASHPPRDAEAASSLDQGLRSGAISGLVLKRIASQYSAQGKLGVSEAVYRRAVAGNARDWHCRVELARVLVQARKYEPAVRELDVVLEECKDASVRAKASQLRDKAAASLGRGGSSAPPPPAKPRV